MNFEPKRKPRIKIIILLIIIGLGNIIFWFFGSSLILLWQTNSLLFSAKWQAVYMADGQVYVGQIRGINAETMELVNAYNLQIISAGQTWAQTTNLAIQSGLAQNVSLIRWGFYQPIKSKGNLFINRSAVMFWETLDDDSQVVEQIKATAK